MDTDLSGASVADLIARFENDVRFGCHSVRAEVSRSLAGQELERRGGEIVQALEDRLKVAPAKNDVDYNVRKGLIMLFYWTTGTTCVPRLAVSDIEENS